MGALILATRRKWRLTADRLEPYRALASQAAIVLENRRLLAAERRRSEELSSLVRISQAFGAIGNLNRAYRELTQHIGEVLDADRCMIALYDPTTREIVGQKPIVFDQVSVDKDMIREVIVNLLSNAVKYTPSGGSVKVETEVDENAGLARVRVTDTGVGIPESEIEHVFDKFYRVGANKKQAKGTGLGLNLVKQMVEKVHDGRVFVTSQVDVGSTFGFELPLAKREKVEAV